MRKLVCDSYEDVNLFATPDIIPPFWIELCGISYCNKSYKIDRNISGVTVIEYIIKGKGTLVIDGNTYYPKAGDIYILPMGSTHSYASSADDPWVKIYMNLQGEAIFHLIKAYRLDGKVTISNCESVMPIFKEIYDKTSEDMPHEQIMEECCMLFNKLLLRLNKHVYESDTASKEAKEIKKIIDANLYNQITIDEISNILFRSNDYINKIFKKNYGLTPHSYYINGKMAAAKALLLNTSLSIAQISEQLGYNDVHYFSRQFRKLNGVPPSEYRNDKNIRY